jgi:hypothetical protein
MHNSAPLLTSPLFVQKRQRLEKNTPLPLWFEPTEYHVICGKGKDCYNFVGNKRFREILKAYIPVYQEADTRIQKSIIVMEIVDKVRDDGPDWAGFVKKIKGSWFEIGDEAAREKVGQALRDCLVRQDPAKLEWKRLVRSISKARRTAVDNFGLLANELSPDKTASFEPTLFPEAVPSPKFPTSSDEILASIPPSLIWRSSRDWFNPDDINSDDTLSVSSSEIDDIFSLPAEAA